MYRHFFEGVSHARCGGDICLVPPTEGRREIGCSKCNFSYMCESLERPIEAVYRFIADGTFEEEPDDDLL
jgi:hypothetical protein